MKRSVLGIAMPLFLLSLAPLSAHAAVVLNPTLVSGANAIDPAGDQTVDQNAAGSTAQATLEALPSFAAIQDFTGWQVQGNTNYVVFTTDTTRPDVMSTYGNLTGGSPGGGTSDTSLRTSPGTSIGIDSGATRTATLTLDFGSATHDGVNVTAFDSAALAPTAVGFTVCGLDRVSTEVTVAYSGPDDTTLLATQTLTKAADPDAGDGTTYGSDGYTGYQSAGGIGKIVVTANQVYGGNLGIAIDDLAYNVVGPVVIPGLVLDPAPVTGADAIDPAGEQTVDQNAPDSVSQATLEALPGFAAIQDFAGWKVQGNTNYIIFTNDTARPDVKSTYGNLTGASPGGPITQTTLRTSPGTSIGIDSGATRTATLTFDFGSATYDGVTVTAFDSTSLAPTSVGFTVCGLDRVSTNVTVKYYGPDDTTLLVTQTLAKAADPDAGDGTTYGSDGYTGYQSAGGIGKIVVTANQVYGGNQGIAIDDLAYDTTGGDYYLTVSGAGAQDGSNWANALPASQLSTVLNTTMAPGDTLFIASGNYGNRTISLTASGTPGNPKSILGVDTGGGVPVFDSANWTRNDPDAGQYSVISLGTGVSHWTIANLALRNCQFAVRGTTSNPDRTGLTFRDLDIQLVRHGFYLSDCDDMIIEDCSVTRYTKHAYRLDQGCDNVVFSNSVADLSVGDATWWDYSEAFPFGFIVNNAGVANTQILFLDCTANNNRQNGQDGYWNGDGFVAEGNTVGVDLNV